jgi:hypothetical protein
MNENELYGFLCGISGISDFTLELKPIHSKMFWGRYNSASKIIRIYQLDENGNPYDDHILIRESLHELVHHIQHHHIYGWKRERGKMHDQQFWELYKSLLDKAFERSNKDGKEAGQTDDTRGSNSVQQAVE